MFPDAHDSGEFREPGEFFEILVANRSDSRLASRAGMEGSGPLGGFAVPMETSAVLFVRSLESSIVRPRAQIWPMKSSERTVPIFQSQNMSEGVFGFTSEWLAELGEGRVQDPSLRTIKHIAKKLAIYTALSREVRDDGLGFGMQIENALIQAISYFMDSAFISGNGVGKPLGILSSGCTLPVVRSTTSMIEYTDVVKMFSKLIPGG